MPSELAIIERAEIYLRKLSCGVNPLTDEMLPEGDSCKQDRISKCLAYVASLLQQQLNHNQVAEPAKEQPKPAQKKTLEPLSIEAEALARYRFFDHPVSISRVVRNINELIPRNAKMNRLLYADVAHFLVQGGILSRESVEDGKESNLPTALGETYGFEKGESDLRGYHNIFTQCTQKAQQYILDNIQKCIDIANERFANKKEKTPRVAIEQEIEKPARKERPKFHLTADQLENYPTDETPVPVSEIARRLNALIDPASNMERIYYKVIRDWYAAKGYLEMRKFNDGKVAFLPTAKGDSAGLMVESRTGTDGNLFDVVVYENRAQKLYTDYLKGA